MVILNFIYLAIRQLLQAHKQCLVLLLAAEAGPLPVQAVRVLAPGDAGGDEEDVRADPVLASQGLSRQQMMVMLLLDNFLVSPLKKI